MPEADVLFGIYETPGHMELAVYGVAAHLDGGCALEDGHVPLGTAVLMHSDGGDPTTVSASRCGLRYHYAAPRDLGDVVLYVLDDGRDILAFCSRDTFVATGENGRRRFRYVGPVR